MLHAKHGLLFALKTHLWTDVDPVLRMPAFSTEKQRTQSESINRGMADCDTYNKEIKQSTEIERNKEDAPDGVFRKRSL